MKYPICERCWAALGPADQFIRLGHIVDVRDDGEPVYVFAYLHQFDPSTDSCVFPDADQAAA